jgi:hypothetical protein
MHHSCVATLVAHYRTAARIVAMTLATNTATALAVGEGNDTALLACNLRKMHGVINGQ